MINSQHLSPEELQSLLNAESDTQSAGRSGEHLQNCEACRTALDRLAAQSAMWQKAPRLLKDDPAALAHLSVDTAAFPRDEKQTENDQDVWEFPLTGLLDPPQHPEMLGRIGKYDIEREVGRGGMGIVLKAHDAELNRPLAIKVLSPHLASHGTARQRFAQEARAAAGVLHPNVIAIHGVNNEGKTPYMVMPFVAGPSLQRLVDQLGPLDEVEIVRIVLQIAAGLTAAHSQGLVHRDIKPANILVEEGVHRVLITDFGLARAEDDASLTRTGWLTGTPNYMSPEQARGDRIDQRSDLFSLGSLLYFLATGRLPFRAESPLGVLNRIQNDQPTPVRQVTPRISATLSDVIDVLLQKKPDARFQSAAEVHGLLERHLAYLHQPDVSKPPRVKKIDTHNGRRTLRQAFTAITAISLLSMGMIGAWSWLPGMNNDSLDPQLSLTAPAIQDDEHPSVPADLIPDRPDAPDDIAAPNPENAWFRVSRENHDDDGSIEFERAYEFYEQGRYEEAVEGFNAAVAFEPYRLKSVYNIGCCWALLGKTDSAIEKLQEAVRLGFNDVDHYLTDNDLDSLRDDERFHELISRLEDRRAIEQLVTQGVSEARAEEYSKAEALLRKALASIPKHRLATFYLGYSLHMQGRIEEAMKWHRQAAATPDYAALANYNLCCAHALRGESDLAFKLLGKAIKTGLVNDVDIAYMEEDTDLDSIRDDQRYAEAVDKIRTAQRHRRQHSRFEIHDEESNISSDSFLAFPQDLDIEHDLNGDWTCHWHHDEMELKIIRTGNDKKATWTHSSHADCADFTPAVTQDTTEFRWDKKFGRLIFKGAIASHRGAGTYRFEAAKKYRQQLSDQGIVSIPDALLFRMFFSEQQEEQIIDNVKKLQALELSENTLAVLMVHGVDASLVERYRDANLSTQEHLEFVVARVPPMLIQRYHDSELDLYVHRDFIRSRVPAELIIGYRDAGLDRHRYERYIVRRIEPQLLQEYTKSGFDLERCEDFINGRVKPQLLNAYEKAGLDLQDNDQFIQWRIEPKLLEEYAEAQYPPHEYQDFVRRRVPACLLQAYDKAGLDLNRYEDFIATQVPIELINDYETAELDLSINRRFVQNRVPASLILRYKQAGYDPQRYPQFIQQRISPSLLQRYDDADLDIEEHKDFIWRRMEPEKVLKIRKQAPESR